MLDTVGSTKGGGDGLSGFQGADEDEDEDEGLELERAPAWHDEDEDEMAVNITSANRTKKLRVASEEQVVSGKEYDLEMT